MEREDATLLRIGLFSQVTRISVRMLRYYQQQGLLIPARIDPESGYRFYAASQVEIATLITQLRAAGFSIEHTGEVLAALDDPERVHALFASQHDRLRAQRRLLDAETAALTRVRMTFREYPMDINVSIKTMPEMTIAALRDRIETYGHEGELWQQIMPLIVASGATFPADGISGATFSDDDYRERDVDVAVWIQTAAPFTPVAPLTCETVPARRVVSATMLGDYSAMSQITAAMGRFIAENQLTTGAMFNIYRVGPAQNPNSDSWVTEACFPIIED